MQTVACNCCDSEHVCFSQRTHLPLFTSLQSIHINISIHRLQNNISCPNEERNVPLSHWDNTHACNASIFSLTRSLNRRNINCKQSNCKTESILSPHFILVKMKLIKQKKTLYTNMHVLDEFLICLSKMSSSSSAA